MVWLQSVGMGSIHRSSEELLPISQMFPGAWSQNSPRFSPKLLQTFVLLLHSILLCKSTLLLYLILIIESQNH